MRAAPASQCQGRCMAKFIYLFKFYLFKLFLGAWYGPSGPKLGKFDDNALIRKRFYTKGDTVKLLMMT
jgi:hypothetical protein